MKKLLLVFFLSLSFFACKKSDPPVEPPTKATLSLPANNEVCTNGTIVSNTVMGVTFKWNASQNADSYEITIKNLESGATITQTTAGLEATINLARNAPYSWFITSKSSKGSATATSDTWKFYSPGEATSSFAPFPAEILSPKMGVKVSPVGGKITLDWNGDDVDKDISNYDIYFGTTNNPAILKAGQVESILNDVTVNPNATYYWKVITRDSKGNTSDSGIYVFYTN
ncbi:MAG: hypothetical protein EOO99_05920 [Pedobacter sp.]|nr:MAG: hypothetical protein EOO99_05920 [Pedobacter sp.]